MFFSRTKSYKLKQYKIYSGRNLDEQRIRVNFYLRRFYDYKLIPYLLFVKVHLSLNDMQFTFLIFINLMNLKEVLY